MHHLVSTPSFIFQFCSSVTNSKPLVPGGRIKGQASFIPLVLKGALEDEDAFEGFLDREGVWEDSPTLFLPIMGIG